MALPPKQAICTARSFGKKTSDFSQIREAVATYTSSCAEKLRQEHGLANLITIFIESHHAWQHMPGSNFCKVVHLPIATNSTLELVRYAVAGLEVLYKEGFVCRKAGVIVSGIIPEGEMQTNMFDTIDRSKHDNLMKAMDTINRTMGKDVVRVGTQGFDRHWWLKQEKLSQSYTTRWDQILTINI